MLKPKDGKIYWFVRIDDGKAVERVEYTRYYDGSADMRVEGGTFDIGFDNDPDAWKLALQHLAHLGYVEEREAKEQGLLLENTP